MFSSQSGESGYDIKIFLASYNVLDLQIWSTDLLKYDIHIRYQGTWD